MGHMPIYRMRDRYRSQLLADRNYLHQAEEDEKEDTTKLGTTTHRTELPTKRRKLTRPEKIDRIDTFDKEEKENQENKSLQDFRAKISGGASDFYSKFKRRHRLNLKTEPSVEPSTPRGELHFYHLSHQNL